jgi:toxin ParE1/3/4
MRIEWTADSLEDIDEIHRYIARDSAVHADRFVEGIFEAAARLVEHPLSGRVVPEFQVFSVREVLLGSYRIIYDIRATAITVNRVFHTARLLKREHIPDIPEISP